MNRITDFMVMYIRYDHDATRMYNAYIHFQIDNIARYVAVRIFRFRAHVPLNPRTLCEFEKSFPFRPFFTLLFFFFLRLSINLFLIYVFRNFHCLEFLKLEFLFPFFLFTILSDRFSLPPTPFISSTISDTTFFDIKGNINN